MPITPLPRLSNELSTRTFSKKCSVERQPLKIVRAGGVRVILQIGILPCANPCLDIQSLEPVSPAGSSNFYLARKTSGLGSCSQKLSREKSSLGLIPFLIPFFEKSDCRMIAGRIQFMNNGIVLARGLLREGLDVWLKRVEQPSIMQGRLVVQVHPRLM